MTEEQSKSILVALGAMLTLFFCLSPFFYMALTSLSRHPDFLLPDKPFGITFSNFLSVICSDSVHFMAFLRNSLIISAASAVISVLIASLAAYAVTRLPVPGTIFLMFLILSVSMFPPVSLVSYLFKLMSILGWVNTYQALVFPFAAWTLPLSLWILVSYFAQVPKDLDKAGLIDGCSRLQILIKIIFPVAAPGIFSTMLLAFIFAFNEFLFALMLTTDHSARTIPVGIALFEGLHGQIPWGEIMAAATITTIPVVILAIVFQRRIIQGLTRGAVKG
jgi:multiple sugar transport system permease protein